LKKGIFDMAVAFLRHICAKQASLTSAVVFASDMRSFHDLDSLSGSSGSTSLFSCAVEV